MEKISINEASERLGIGQTTVKNWCDMLHLAKQKDGKNRRIITPNEFEILEIARALKEEGHSHNTIIRRVGRSPDDDPTAVGRESDDRRAAVGQLSGSQPTVLADAISSQLVLALREDKELTLALSQASHQIGRLEERCENQAQTIEDLRRELEASKTAHQNLQMRLQAAESPKEPPRPWWKVKVW